MAYPAYIREKARELRTKKKLTIDEIAERLAIPRTTIYGWVRDLEIPRKPNDGWPESGFSSSVHHRGPSSISPQGVHREFRFRSGAVGSSMDAHLVRPSFDVLGSLPRRSGAR